jgi:MFS family permease
MEFRRDRLTWIAYALLAWFAYLQAAPGLVIGHLRDELDLSYSTGGLHVAAFAAGAMVAGVISARLERALGRRQLFWSSAGLMGAGAIGLTAGRIAEVTVGSVLVMGVGGGLLLVTIQAALADQHGERRAVALTEANVAASIGYVVLIGVLSLTAALHAGWRIALLASLAVPVLVWWTNRRLAIDAPPPSHVGHDRLPRAFWIAGAMLFCTTAAEWCIIAWGATFVEDAADVSTDTAVALMAGYFSGVVAGRMLGSRLARRRDPARLLALALAVTGVGFAILWPATGPAQALVGLSLLGVGFGNLFPMGMSVTVALAPDRAVLASGRAVAMAAFAVLLAPLTVGTLADAMSLTAAFGVVPVALVLAAAGLTLVRRAQTRAGRSPATGHPGRRRTSPQKLVESLSDRSGLILWTEVAGVGDHDAIGGRQPCLDGRAVVGGKPRVVGSPDDAGGRLKLVEHGLEVGGVLLVEAEHLADPELLALLAFPLVEVGGEDVGRHRGVGRGAQLGGGDFAEDVRGHRAVGVGVSAQVNGVGGDDPGAQDVGVDQSDAAGGDAFEQVSAQHRGAAEVVADQRRRVKAPGSDELREHLALHADGDLLVLVALGLTEAEQIEDMDGEVFGQGRRDVAPQDRAAGRPVDEDDGRPVADHVPGDLASRRRGASGQGPSSGISGHQGSPVRR